MEVIIVLIVCIYLIIKLGSLFNRPCESPQEIGQRAEEHLVYQLSKFGMDQNDIFHDLYIEKSNGLFTQIDVAALTDAGIIIFEVKNYSGWIFGNGNDKMWTQVLAYGREKYRFYNPLKQNLSHVQALRKKLCKFRNIPVYSVIVFDGDCELRKIECIPTGTYVLKMTKIYNVLNTILDNQKSLNYDRNAVRKIFIDGMENGKNQVIRDNHVNNTIRYTNR